MLVRALASLAWVITSWTGVCGPLLGQGVHQQMQCEVVILQDMVGQS
jgi:hypothetical protein